MRLVFTPPETRRFVKPHTEVGGGGGGGGVRRILITSPVYLSERTLINMSSCT